MTRQARGSELPRLVLLALATGVGAAAGAGAGFGYGGEFAPFPAYLVLVASAFFGAGAWRLVEAMLAAESRMSPEARAARGLLLLVAAVALLVIGGGGWILAWGERLPEASATIVGATAAIGAGVLASCGGLAGIWVAMHNASSCGASPSAELQPCPLVTSGRVGHE